MFLCLMMVCHHTKVSQNFSCCDDTRQRVFLRSQTITVTLALKTVIQSLCITLWLVMTLHHTKLGSKRFSSSEDIVLTKTLAYRWAQTETDKVIQIDPSTPTNN